MKKYHVPVSTASQFKGLIQAFHSVRTFKKIILASSVCLLLSGSTHAAIVISEVHPSGSGNGNYAADWFELTNTGVAAVDITGWKVDDSSNAFASALALRGVTSINPGQSVIFAEGDATGSTDTTIAANFKNAWFGVSVPAGFTIGGYGGSAIGLSTSGDAVNIFDALGARVTGVAFNASTAGITFDNAAGLGSSTLPTPGISTLSVAGVNGAFTSSISEIGSPGAIQGVPEPGTVLLLVFGAGILAVQKRRRSRA